MNSFTPNILIVLTVGSPAALPPARPLAFGRKSFNCLHPENLRTQEKEGDLFALAIINPHIAPNRTRLADRISKPAFVSKR
jgi:hypothetical protein